WSESCHKFLAQKSRNSRRPRQVRNIRGEMQELDHFVRNSLRKMRAELIGMQKDDLTFKSLSDLLPKYRDGLVASGAYNPISQMHSGQQYVTDPEQLDAVRRETIKMVDAAVAAMDGVQTAAPVLHENEPRQS